MSIIGPSKGRKTATYALNELTIHFHSRRTKPPTYAYTVMCSVLRSGNSRSVREYVQKHTLHRNSPPPLCSRLRPPFSHIMCSGAELMHSASTHTPCNTIINFRLDAYFDHFTPCAPKQDRKMGVANSSISRYLLSITPFCNVSSSHLTSIRQYAQSTVEKIRLFSYFSNPVALLKSENPASLSRPILAL